MSEIERDSTTPEVVQWAYAQSVGSQGAFEDEGRSPSSWCNVAFDLKRAAELLMPIEMTSELTANIVKSKFAPAEVQTALKHMQRYMSLEHVSLMLLGMSFENLIKGLLIAADPTLVSAAGLDRKLATHDLRTLCDKLNRSGIQMTSEDIDLLHPLFTSLIVWGGRYPIPRRQTDIVKQFSHTSQTMLSCKRLWEKLHATLKAKVQK